MKNILTSLCILFKVDENCHVKKAPIGSSQIIDDLNVPFTADPENPGSLPCTFPFRYKHILYYACTNITLDTVTSGLGSAQYPIHLCAIQKDLDFNPTMMGFCDTTYRCPIQCKLKLGNEQIFSIVIH